MTTTTGSITIHTKKGYESINRDMLQDGNLSLESIGLLSNIISYSENWKLNKTELYTRFNKNKRTSIDRMWDELVSNGYIVQFRKRVGRKYVYQYLVTSHKFNKEEISSIISKVKETGYLFYHKAMLKMEDMSKINPLDFIVLKEPNAKKEYKKDEVLDFSDIISSGEVEDNSSVDNKQSTDNSSNHTDSKSIFKRFTIKKVIKEEELFKGHDKISREYKESFRPEINELKSTLHRYMIRPSYSELIADEFIKSSIPVDMDIVLQQLKWMVIKSKSEDGIGSVVDYFVNGYLKRLSNSRLQSPNEDDVLPYIPMYNWVEGEEAYV